MLQRNQRWVIDKSTLRIICVDLAGCTACEIHDCRRLVIVMSPAGLGREPPDGTVTVADGINA